MINFLVDLLTVSNYLSSTTILIIYTVSSFGTLAVAVYNTKYRTLKQAYVSRILLVLFLSVMMLLMLNVVVVKATHHESVVLFSIPFTLIVSYIFLKGVRAINYSRKY